MEFVKYYTPTLQESQSHPSFPHAKQLGHEMDQLLKQGRADVMSGRKLFTNIDIDIICHSDGKPVAFHENNIVSFMLWYQFLGLSKLVYVTVKILRTEDHPMDRSWLSQIEMNEPSY